MRRIDERSGSAKTASKAITDAFISVSRSIRRATMVRGHGHWPNSASAASSISTIRTGVVGE